MKSGDLRRFRNLGFRSPASNGVPSMLLDGMIFLVIATDEAHGGFHARNKFARILMAGHILDGMLANWVDHASESLNADR